MSWDSSPAFRMVPRDTSSRPAAAAAGYWAWLVPAIAVVVFAAYFPALRAGFIWDDDAHVTAPALRSVHGIWRIWFEPGATQQYYPLLHSFFWVQYRLWGSSAFGYHLANLVLHTVAAVLVAVLLRRERIPGAALAAFVFALHPVQVETVAWISEQKNTLSAVFYLAAALAFLRFQNASDRLAPDHARSDAGTPPAAGRPRPLAWYALATALFLAALLTKSVTASLPAALLVLAWWRHGRISWRRDALPLLPWFVLAIASGTVTAIVEHSFVGATGAAFDLSATQRLVLAGRALWFYLGKLCWPTHLVFFYPRWTLDPSAAWQWLPLVGAVAVAGLLAIFRKRSRAPLAAALYFGGTLVPALGFVNVYPFRYSYVADHFQYLATLGPIVLASATATLALSRWGRAIGIAAAASLVAGLGCLTWHRTHAYRDADTLYRTTLEQNPRSWIAANNLGKDQMATRAGLPEAISLFERALTLNPDYPEAENNLGLALAEVGRAAEAIPHLERAVALKPKFYQAYNNLGIAYARTRQLDRAVAAFGQAVALNPRLPNLQENLGKALTELGRSAEAAGHFQRAAELRAEAKRADEGSN